MPVSLPEVTSQLVAVLKEALEGAEKWSYFTDHGADAGLFGTVAKLSAAEASRNTGGTSIAAHVHHVTFGLKASADWLRGDHGHKNWQESWQVTTVDEAGWRRLQADLHSSYQELQQAMQSHAVDDVMARGGAVGAIAHVAYHLGAIKQKVAGLRQP
jgi:hypothetical protein